MPLRKSESLESTQSFTIKDQRSQGLSAHVMRHNTTEL